MEISLNPISVHCFRICLAEGLNAPSVAVKSSSDNVAQTPDPDGLDFVPKGGFSNDCFKVTAQGRNNIMAYMCVLRKHYDHHSGKQLVDANGLVSQLKSKHQRCNCQLFFVIHESTLFKYFESIFT